MGHKNVRKLLVLEDTATVIRVKSNENSILVEETLVKGTLHIAHFNEGAMEQFHPLLRGNRQTVQRLLQSQACLTGFGRLKASRKMDPDGCVQFCLNKCRAEIDGKGVPTKSINEMTRIIRMVLQATTAANVSKSPS